MSKKFYGFHEASITTKPLGISTIWRFLCVRPKRKFGVWIMRRLTTCEAGALSVDRPKSGTRCRLGRITKGQRSRSRRPSGTRSAWQSTEKESLLPCATTAGLVRGAVLHRYARSCKLVRGGRLIGQSLQVALRHRKTPLKPSPDPDPDLKLTEWSRRKRSRSRRSNPVRIHQFRCRGSHSPRRNKTRIRSIGKRGTGTTSNPSVSPVRHPNHV